MPAPPGSIALAQQFTYAIPQGLWEHASIVFRGTISYTIQYSASYTPSVPTIYFTTYASSVEGSDKILFPPAAFAIESDFSLPSGTTVKTVPFNCEIVFPVQGANYNQALAYINASGGGNAQFYMLYYVTPPSGVSLGVSMTVTGATLRLCGQDLLMCEYEIDPATRFFPVAGGTGTISVRATLIPGG
jgi:hypothetical protein